MPISRPLLLALLAALLAMATFYAAAGAQRASSEPETAPVALKPEPAPKASKPDRAPSERDASKQQATARGDAEAERSDRHDARSQLAERGRRADRRRAERAPAPLPPELRVDGLPRPVARALAAKRTIVLFFRQGAADDALTADAVDGVRGLRGLSVFSAPIDRLGRYRAVVPGLAIARAPAVAIIDGKRSARVLEGFVDPGTLRQLVLDAR